MYVIVPKLRLIMYICKDWCCRLFAVMTMNTVVQTDTPVTYLSKSATSKMENQFSGQQK